ncbi:MAG: amidohydrolase [Fulvivirga sp.]|nr:amidohydrolase [Fulvivirga sp.]
MQDLNITLIQSELHWKDPDANLAMFEEKIWQIEKATDVIVLPEMLTTGFNMDSEELAEPVNFRAYKWFRQMAEQTKAAVTGSVIIKDEDKYYNRLIWMEPDGKCRTYDKRHLFRMADEHAHYSPGDQRLIVTWRDWRICPMICYDLRFPVWSRNTYLTDLHRMNYDLLLFVANWPAARVNAWDILLKARAVENLAYCAGVNRVGTDGNDIAYCGHSAVIDFKGNEVADLGEQQTIKSVTLAAGDLQKYRKKFPAYLDADKFSVVF